MTSTPLDSTRFRQPLVRRFAIALIVRGAVAVLVAAGWVALTGSLFARPIQAAENPPAATPVAAVAAGPILIAPATVSLNHVRQPQSLQVLGQSADGFSLDLRSQAQFRSADPKVATVDGQGWVQPVATGQTQISIDVAGQSLVVPVSVTLSDAVPLFSFRHEVMPVVSKAACNSGACHGYSLGKNGFKLSLRGADPAQDFLAITKEQFGRRLNLQFPQESLVLAKPNGTTPHEGGIRFKAGSLSNELLLAWVRQGAPGDLADTRAVASVRLGPDRLVLLPGQKHQLQMIATYTDGSQRDVTRLGIFSANNTQFADVTEEGLVTAGDAGETAIVGRFERTFTAASILAGSSDRPARRRETEPPEDHSLATRGRRRVLAAGLFGSDRTAAQTGGDPGVSRGYRNAEAGGGRGLSVCPSRVCRSLVVEMGRPPAKLPERGQPAVGVHVSRVSPRGGRRESASRRVRSEDSQ
ncbi:MAG: Ig-like domain-containing protein, partial [Planctomycetota bacterium]|nr:Ig-like domain-containing protein [Planctomycetota bacterium]